MFFKESSSLTHLQIHTREKPFHSIYGTKVFQRHFCIYVFLAGAGGDLAIPLDKNPHG